MSSVTPADEICCIIHEADLSPVGSPKEEKAKNHNKLNETSCLVGGISSSEGCNRDWMAAGGGSATDISGISSETVTGT